MKKFDIHRYWIPGKSMSTVFVPLGIWTFVYVVSSMVRYSYRLSIVFRIIGWYPANGWSYGTAQGKAPLFNSVIKGCFSGYWLLLLLCLSFILGLYMFLRRDRSLYIMKRLPAAETFKRCALLLLIYAVVILAATFIIVAIMHARYMAMLPEEVLPPEEPLKLFKALSITGRFNYVFDYGL